MSYETKISILLVLLMVVVFIGTFAITGITPLSVVGFLSGIVVHLTAYAVIKRVTRT